MRVRKVKLEGRRRLCKLSSETTDETPDENLFDSPPRAKDAGGGGGGGGESIRDILDDLTSRLDALSVEKPRPKPVSCDPEPEVEYESAASSLSPSSIKSSPGKDEEGEAKKKEVVKGKAVGRFCAFEDEEEEVCVISGSGGGRESNEGEGENGLVEVLDDESVEALSDDDEGDYFTMAGAGSSKSRMYKLPGKIAKMLYPHQRDGLKWLWTLHCSGTGGILGDDMGLGKTMQV